MLTACTYWQSQLAAAEREDAKRQAARRAKEATHAKRAAAAVSAAARSPKATAIASPADRERLIAAVEALCARTIATRAASSHLTIGRIIRGEAVTPGTLERVMAAVSRHERRRR